MTQQKILVHQKTKSIEWGDMDALGHVNNARYFEYFQEARIEWLAQLALDLTQTTGPVIVQTSCTFLKPIIYPAAITISTYLHTLGRTSILVEHDVHQDEQLMAQATCKIVWVDYQKNKAVALPLVIRDLSR